VVSGFGLGPRQKGYVAVVPAFFASGVALAAAHRGRAASPIAFRAAALIRRFFPV